MASVFINGGHMVLISLDKIAVYTLGSAKKQIISLPTLRKESKPGDGKDDGTDRILAAAFSTTGKYFAICDDHKRLAIWSVEDSWNLLNTRPIARRANALVICEQTQTILVADKSGDVHKFSFASKEENIVGCNNVGGGTNEATPMEEDTLVMGHVSMLLDLKLVAEGRLLVTCDRDEKIRVSHYPNSYNIQSFCLGHTDFVSRLSYLEDKDLLLSGSGDGTIKLWDYRNGRLLDDVDCSVILDKTSLAADLVPSSTSYEAVICKCNAVDLGVNRCRGADVRCLAYSRSNNIVAVSFESRPTVLLFQLTRAREDETFTLSYVQRIQTNGLVWDIAFVTERDLLVLQSYDGATVLPYRIQQNASLAVPLTEDAEGSTDLRLTIDAVNDNPSFFKDCHGMKNEASKLHKVHIDNMKDYMERKKGRIQHNKTSATAGGEEKAVSREEGKNGESITKKIKFTETLDT